MKKITNLIIIDASSSMGTKEVEVKGGLKQLFKDIKKDMKDNVDVTYKNIICQFSSPNNFRVLVNSKKKSKLTDGIAESYVASGMTALFDAIGKGFELVGKKQDGVFVNIITDGEENSSQEFKSEDIKRLFKQANEKKWGLTFMGASQESITMAHSLGVSSTNTVLFSNDGQGVSQATFTAGISRSMYSTSVMNSATLDEIQNENLIVKHKKQD